MKQQSHIFKAFIFILALAMGLCFSQTLSAKETIVVDCSGIDARSDLSAAEKQALKDKIVDEIKDNYESALGEDGVEVTTDTSKPTDRTVKILNQFSSPKGKAWGGWPSGSKTSEVYLKEFMDNPKFKDAFRNDDGSVNTGKMGNAIGQTASHEVGHSYSVGHNGNTGDDVNKMTKGSNVSAETKATKSFDFDKHSKDTIKKNAGKKPCTTATDYDIMALMTDYDYFDAGYENLACELGGIDAYFSFNGAWAPFFDFGWYGEDSDNGLIDGNEDYDFIFKSSMFGNDTDAEIITFFEQSHQGAQFLLRGAEGTPIEGEWFPLQEGDLLVSDFVGDNGQLVNMGWDVDANGTYDIIVTLDARHPDNGTNGFRYQLPPVVRITETDGFNLVYEPGTIPDTYTVTLGAETYDPVDVTIISQTADISLNGAPAGEPITLHFPPGTWMDAQVVDITAVPDGEPEGEETIYLTHIVDSPDPRYMGLVLEDYSVIVCDSNPDAMPVEPMPDPDGFTGGTLQEKK